MLSKASSPEPSWPDETELFELVLPMLTGGSGAPAAPAAHFEPAEATHSLLVRVNIQ